MRQRQRMDKFIRIHFFPLFMHFFVYYYALVKYVTQNASDNADHGED
jgi:hypothetical protein